MNASEAQIRSRLIEVFERETEMPPEVAAELAFHLTDWLTDLDDLASLYASDTWDPEAAQALLMRFIVHVPAHLAAAYRILMDEPLTDVFKIGAVHGEGKGTRNPGEPYTGQ